MRNIRIQRLVVAGLGAGLVTMSVIAGPLSSSASTVNKVSAHSAANTLYVPLIANYPNSVFPFYDGANCETVNIDYWNLMSRPGYWFGLGSAITEQPTLSALNQPTYATSGVDTVVTMKSKGWKWTESNTATPSQTETLTNQDVEFWLNMDVAQTHNADEDNSCGYAGGFGLPDQVVSVTETGGANGNTIKIKFSGHESHGWLLSNELSQIDPMPAAWDTTNGTNHAGCSTESFAYAKAHPATCEAVFEYLNSLQINSTLWNWADGPYRQECNGSANATNNTGPACPAYASGSPTGDDVQVANTKYSGPASDKPHAVKTIQYVEYATVDTEITALQAGQASPGSPPLDTGAVDPSDVAAAPGPGLAGANNSDMDLGAYKTVGGVLWGVFYFYFNFGTTGSTWPSTAVWANIENQQYVREAMQEAENQADINTTVNNGYSVSTYSAIPAYPSNPYKVGVTNPYGFSINNARALLTSHGWSNVPSGSDSNSGTATCGIHTGNGCGSAGHAIPFGTPLTLTLIYPSGSTATTDQIDDEVVTMGEAGINIVASSEEADLVGAACFGGSSEWQLCGYGGWIYAPDYYPSGEELYATGASSNVGGYSNAEMDTLIKDTTTNGNKTLNGSNTAVNPHTSYAQWTATDLPVLWQPTPTSFGEQIKTMAGEQPGNPLGDFNPEYITTI